MVPPASSGRRLLVVVQMLALVAVSSAHSSAGRDTQPPPSAVANDNRTPAGALKNGTLELSLEITMGLVHPEDEQGTGLFMATFGEAGKPPSNPAPLLRVPEGTEVHVAIKNSLDHAAVVHGLHTRPGDDSTPLEVPAGETRDVRFPAGAPGTYFYWASSTGAKDLSARDSGAVDTQLGRRLRRRSSRGRAAGSHPLSESHGSARRCLSRWDGHVYTERQVVAVPPSG